MSPTQEPTDCRLTFLLPPPAPSGRLWESVGVRLRVFVGAEERLPESLSLAACSGLPGTLSISWESGLCVGCYEASPERTPSFPVSFPHFPSTSAHLIPSWPALSLVQLPHETCFLYRGQITTLPLGPANRRELTEWRYWSHSHCRSPLCLPYVPIPIHLFVRYLLDAEPSAWPLRHRRNWAKVPAWRSLGYEKGQFIHQSPCDEAHATERRLR